MNISPKLQSFESPKAKNRQPYLHWAKYSPKVFVLKKDLFTFGISSSQNSL
jgi:hypothetical protein